MVNNSSLQKWDRLRQKQLSRQFVNEVIHGLNCSPFEARAVLETVLRVFQPYFATNGALQPGQMYCSVVSQQAAPQLALKDCPMVTVILTLDAGEEDLAIKARSGVEALRRHRLERLCREAFQQGGVLTLEDLAHRLLNCGERTLCRDLARLRKEHIVLPLRSQIKDMGRSRSHRTLIVEQYLAGKDWTLIARDTCHSIASVENYVEKFKRTIGLAREGYDEATIAFLVRISRDLVNEYRMIHKKAKIVPFRQKELRSFLKKDLSAPGGAQRPEERRPKKAVRS